MNHPLYDCDNCGQLEETSTTCPVCGKSVCNRCRELTMETCYICEEWVCESNMTRYEGHKICLICENELKKTGEIK